MANWTNETQPFGANRHPLLTGLSATDGVTPVPVAVNPATGAIVTSGGGGGSGTQYQEGATTSPATGTLALARYQATPPSLTDGQMWEPQLDSAGNLKVTGSLSVGGTTDNSAFTAGSGTGTPSMGFYHSTIDTVTDGRAAVVGITSKRAMLTNLQNSSGTEVGTASTPLQVSLANTGANSTAVKVDGSAVTQPISYTSVVNAGNSSTSTLTSGSTFTGTGVSILGYSRVTVQVVSDQSSATNGVSLQFSEDNTNWTDASLYTYTAGGSSPNNGQIYGVSARGQYFRVVYTNGGTGQTSFALQTVLHPFEAVGDLVTMSVVPNSTNHALLTKSSIVGLTTGGGGGFVDVKVNPSGALTADVTQATSPWIVAGGGTAGTAASGVVTVQGIASMTPVQVSQATAANLNATVVGTGTFAVQATLSAGTALVGKVGIDQTTLGTTNNVSISGSTGAGTSALIKDDTAFGDGLTTGVETVAGRLYNTASYDRPRSVINGTNSTGTGIQAVGNLAQFDDVSPTSITENQFGNLRMSANRNLYGTIRDAAGNERGVNVNASNQLSVSIDGSSATNISTNIAQMNGVTVTMGNGVSGTGVQRVTVASDSTGQLAVPASSTATGTTFYFNSALSSTKQAANASAGNVYGYHIYNPNSAVAYVQMFNLASGSVTVGSTTPTQVIAVPAGGWADESFTVPLGYTTALTVAATTTSTGSGTPTTGLLTNIFYK